MRARAGAVQQDFREFWMGLYSARIVDQCVRAETGYLGGQRKMNFPGEPSEWIIRVIAAVPPGH